LTPLESACIAALRARSPEPVAREPRAAEDWIAFSLSAGLEAARMSRAVSGTADKGILFKEDGSPVTPVEAEIESMVSRRLASFCPEASFVGEESGGQLPSSGFAVAMDPIDGTWAFLAETQTHSTTISVFRDGVAELGVICNPSTGEIAYAPRGGTTRLVRLSLFGEDDFARTLRPRVEATGHLLVNMHPNRRAASLIDDLYGAWQRNHIRMVRSPGGSPSWALLEAAKGHYVYINIWSPGAPEAYDLTAGVLIVRGAGGEVTDSNGKPIDELKHQGPFVAALNSEARESVCELLRENQQAYGNHGRTD
jgi:fructose-1,6-bisphosphatase/inositol monophosphatase family enzyme